MSGEKQKEWSHESEDGRFRYEQTLDDGILAGSFVGSMTQQDAVDSIVLISQARDLVNTQLAYLVDVNAMNDVSPEARRTMTSFITGDGTPLSMIAIFGGNFFIRNIFNLFLRISTIPAQAFPDREGAMEWIKSKIA